MTVLLKPQAGSRRWQHAASGRAAAEGNGRTSPVESNYTVILGSHRNSCLKFEKDGEICCMVWQARRGALGGAERSSWLEQLGGAGAGGAGFENCARACVTRVFMLPGRDWRQPSSTNRPPALTTINPSPGLATQRNTTQVNDVPGARLSSSTFTKFWLNYDNGCITVGSGERWVAGHRRRCSAMQWPECSVAAAL